MNRFIVVFALLSSASASADDVTGIVFVPQPVVAPVPPDRVQPVAPFVPAGASELAGDVVVGPDRAATLWLDALDVVQVRKINGDGVIKLARVVGAGKTRAVIVETGVPAGDNITHVAQPPGGGDVWMIYASRAATIRVERPVARDGRAIWETTQHALLAWVDSGGTRPAIPVVDGAYAAALRIDADASTGTAIETLEPAQRGAVRAWRKASIVAELAAIRPFVQPQLAIESLDNLPGMGASVTVIGPKSIDPQPYHRIAKPQTLEVELEGPGALRIEARALLPAPRGGVANAPELPDVSVAIASEGAVSARRTVAATYAIEQEAGLAPSAFPAKKPLTSREGDTLGERVMVAVPLYPGKHRYHVVLDGGAIAVRATVARHRPRMSDAVSTDDVDEWLAQARDGVAGTTPGATLVRALIDARAGLATKTTAPKLPAALRAAWIAATGDVAGRIEAIKATDKAHAWTHALAIARRLPDGDAVRALYAAVPGSPPASFVPDLVALLPRSTPLERVRNWPLAATLLAARARPVDPTVNAAVRARWRTAEWAQIKPTLDGRDEDLPPARKWLVEAEPSPFATPRAWRTGDLARLEPNRARTVTATASTLDASRAALLDVYVAATEQGPIEIAVDGKRMQTLAIAPVERVQIAVAPGAHEVKISGPKSLRGWVSQLPATPVDAADRARVQSLWPAVEQGTKLKYALPGADLPIEVSLRVSGRIEERIRVTLKSDVGPATELEITNGARDARARAVDAPSDVSEELRFVVWPARGARSVWIESPDAARLVASIATRRERTLGKRVLPSTKTTINADLLARVTQASKTLAADPENAAALASRANDLLDLGEPGYAREDLLRLLGLPAAKKLAASAVIEEELFARLDDSTEPTHVAVVQRVEQPMLVGPALAAVVTDKQEGAIATVIAARKELAQGNTLAAAKLLVTAYQATDRWPVALEAVELLGRVITDRKVAPPAGMLSLTYGLAVRVRQHIDHSKVRRALVVAAVQSGWDTLGAVTSSAGHEVVLSTRPILPPSPQVMVREALVAPSWQVRSGHTLTAGNAGVLDITLPAAMAVRAQVHCVRVRSASDEPCAFAVRVDSGVAKADVAPLGRTIEIPLALTAGRHVIEVSLASEGDAASVRFASEREIAGVTGPAEGPGTFPIRIERRTKVFTATPAQPITTSVQGPITLWVQARAVHGTGAKSAEVLATASSGAPVRAVLPFVQDRDDDARGDAREVKVSSPNDVFLILPEATTYQIKVEPNAGQLVARMALRDERRSKPPKAPLPWYAAAPMETAAFTIAQPPAIGAIAGEAYDPPAMGRAGTLSFEIRGEQDSRGDEDVIAKEPGAFLESGVAFRRTLSPRRFWLTARAGIRAREETAAIATAGTDVYLDQLPLGATLTLTGLGYTQSFSEGRAWHLRGRARLGWRFDLTDTLTARPQLGFGASYMNTTEAIASVATDRLDPDVYNAYRDSHARDANAAFAMQWMPLQDLVGELRTNAVSNQDMASLDYAGVGIGVRMLAPLPLLGDTLLATSYRPNYRFADDDRPSGYWRHDIVSRVEWSLWTTTQGRIVLSAWDEYYPGKRNSFGAGIRFDLTRHRGLADFSPNDAPFASLVDERPYAPLEQP